VTGISFLMARVKCGNRRRASALLRLEKRIREHLVSLLANQVFYSFRKSLSPIYSSLGFLYACP
jgi:hypothetical protein